MRYLWKDFDLPPGEVFRLARAEIPYRKPFPYHGHDFPEVFWVGRGHGIHQVNGRRIPLQAGDVVFIRPTDEHGFHAHQKADLVLWNLSFPAACLRDLASRYFRGRAAYFWSGEELPEMRHLDRGRVRGLELAAEAGIHRPRSRLQLDRLLLGIFDELEAGMPSIEQTEEVPQWLLEACRDAGRPEILAGGCGAFIRRAGRSAEHVSRTFHRHYGKTLASYIIGLRMEYAARELASGTRSIIEIADDCGYSNLSYFYQRFKATHGLPPRQYRLRNRVV